jgi:hypothetical protein
VIAGTINADQTRQGFIFCALCRARPSFASDFTETARRARFSLHQAKIPSWFKSKKNILNYIRNHKLPVSPVKEAGRASTDDSTICASYVCNKGAANG